MSTLIIHGERPTRRFTKTPNELINEAELSGLAIAIATFILSKPEGWKTDLKALYRRYTKDSKYAIRKAVGELQEFGLLSIEFIKEGRRFTECVWHFMLDALFSLDSVPQHPQGQHGEDEDADQRDRLNNTESIKTDCTKTVSNKSAAPDSQGVTNRLQEMINRLSKRKVPAALLEHRQNQEKEFARIQQEAEERRLGEWGARLKGFSPEETVNALYDHFLAANPNRTLDAGNIAQVIAWQQEHNNLSRLVEAFTLAKAQSKTLSAKYVLRILNGF